MDELDLDTPGDSGTHGAALAGPASPGRVPKDVRAWHDANKEVPLISGDWGPRAETGESVGIDPSTDRNVPPIPLDEAPEWQTGKPVWTERSEADQEKREALENFIEQRLWTLSERDRKLIEFLYWEQGTQQAYADSVGVSRVAITKAAGRVMKRFRADRAFQYDLNVFWKARFGEEYPGLSS